MIRTTTDTNIYTKARINIIQEHFELFVRCGGMNDKEVDKLLQAVEKRELEAVGIYIEENGYRIAEVEFQVDWEEHLELTHVYGDIFDADLPGWKEGVAPEAYVIVSRLAKEAKKRNLSVNSWIRVSDSIRISEKEHKRVCDELGYSFDSPPPKWRDEPHENSRSIEGLKEAKVTTRHI